MKRWTLTLVASATALALTMGCTTLDERQRAWIFQPSDSSWGASASAAEGMEDIWIDFRSEVTGEEARLHGLWLPARQNADKGPVMLYLHGARWNVTGSAPRIRRMQELGFSVLAIDYRGFGQSLGDLPSERSVYADARIGWRATYTAMGIFCAGALLLLMHRTRWMALGLICAIWASPI